MTQFTMCLSSPTKDCIFFFQNGCEITKCKVLRTWEVLTDSLLPLSICFELYLVLMFAAVIL